MTDCPRQSESHIELGLHPADGGRALTRSAFRCGRMPDICSVAECGDPAGVIDSTAESPGPPRAKGKECDTF